MAEPSEEKTDAICYICWAPSTPDNPLNARCDSANISFIHHVLTPGLIRDRLPYTNSCPTCRQKPCDVNARWIDGNVLHLSAPPLAPAAALVPAPRRRF